MEILVYLKDGTVKGFVDVRMVFHNSHTKTFDIHYRITYCEGCDVKMTAIDADQVARITIKGG